jgi:hypothetical protein
MRPETKPLAGDKRLGACHPGAPQGVGGRDANEIGGVRILEVVGDHLALGVENAAVA